MSQGFSDEAVAVAKAALERGNGVMAQFSHPELGGTGQWMAGMVLIGDAFNQPLKARVAALFAELADATSAAPRTTAFPPQPSWWPEALGTPVQVSTQNGLSCAIFPEKHYLAVRRDEAVTIYDTGDHVVTGVSAQNARLLVHTAAGQSIAAEAFPEKRFS